ncbi:MAG: putative lipid II flippase FtsW [Gemmatimonadetes bacterium]|nr:putative lipid II flippase FtsW [Gemmatimonadota bacterium]
MRVRALPLDVAPPRPTGFADSGIGWGWEPAALLVVTVLLLSFGLVTLYSASSFLAQREHLPDYYYVLRQAAGAGVGLALLALCSRIPYRSWRRLAWPLLAVVLILLLVLLLPGTREFAPEINGARRWLKLGGITLQPSELAKFVVVVWTAALAVKGKERLAHVSRGFLPLAAIWALLAAPIVLEPDLSTAVLVVALGGLVALTAGARVLHFAVLGLAALPLLASELAQAYRLRRVLAFLDPETDPSGAAYQVQQSLIAVGSGGLAGVGFGEGRQQFGFIPEAHNDFIFAMIGEEWGFIGVTLTVGLYLTLVLIGFRVARRAPDHFGELLAVGLTSLIATSAVLHMGVGLGLIPATGVTLPLMSYGRSNLLVSLAAMGVLVAIARAGSAGRGSRG